MRSIFGRPLVVVCAVLSGAVGTLRSTLNAAETGQIVVIRRGEMERSFEGIGAVSAGASSRLLADYPEPQRSQILDLLFKPKFGASLTDLKVEIGGDINSTCGAEPSHARTRDELEHPQPAFYQRGYEWWLMEQAKARNPAIRLGCLEWGVPGWVGGGKFYSEDNLRYVIAFLSGARRYHGLEFEYVGLWNERPYDSEYIKHLRLALDQKGFKRVKIVAADLCCKAQWSIAQVVARDPSLLGAIDAFGDHYPERYDQAPVRPYASDETLQATGKPIWNSEGGPWNGNWAGFGYLARMYNRDYLEGRITKTLTWSVITAHYPDPAMPVSGLMTARTPWCGSYEVEPAMWAAAHTTQFAEPGWKYLESGCGYLQHGGSLVTLADPAERGRMSIIAETLDSPQRQAVAFELPEGVTASRCAVWRTIQGGTAFERLPDAPVEHHQVRIMLEPHALYSITTSRGQSKGTGQAPAPAPFPFPYASDFSRQAVGRSPSYFADQCGAFEIAARSDGKGNCLRQMIVQPGIEWEPGVGQIETIWGNPQWADYRVGADVHLLESYSSAAIWGRVGETHRSHQSPDGYGFKVHSSGAWELLAGKDLLASGWRKLDGDAWHRLALRMTGATIEASIDGQQVASVRDLAFTSGLAGLAGSYHPVEFDRVRVD